MTVSEMVAAAVMTDGDSSTEVEVQSGDSLKTKSSSGN